MPDLTTKSNLTCPVCKDKGQVIRFQWLDRYPEGSHWYDDHICLTCGRDAKHPNMSVCAESLEEYRKEWKNR